MRFSPTLALAMVALGALVFGSGEASAGRDRCPAGDNVCIAYLKAENSRLRAELAARSNTTTTIRVKRRVQVVAPRPQQVRTTTRRHTHVARVSGKSCALFRQRQPSALVAYAGAYSSRGNYGAVLASGSPKWKKVSGVYQAVFCVSKAKLAEHDVVTVCGEDTHYTFRGHEIVQFRAQSGSLGHADIARMWGGG